MLGVSTHCRPGRLRGDKNIYYQQEKKTMMLDTGIRTPNRRENIAPKVASNGERHGFTAERRKVAIASEESRPRVAWEGERAA
jgi:hypothetical protein